MSLLRRFALHLWVAALLALIVVLSFWAGASALAQQEERCQRAAHHLGYHRSQFDRATWLGARPSNRLGCMMWARGDGMGQPYVSTEELERAMRWVRSELEFYEGEGVTPPEDLLNEWAFLTEEARHHGGVDVALEPEGRARGGAEDGVAVAQ